MSRPRVTVSFAQSLDGRIATVTGQSQWISGPETLHLSQELRRDNEAILVGIGTVLRDDPLLTCRLPGCRSPHRVILDSALRLPSGSRIAATAGEVPTTVFTVSGDPAREDELRDLGVEVRRCGSSDSGLDTGIPIPEVLESLAESGLRSLYVEGGGRVITSFLAARQVDRLIVVVAPLLIGAGVDAVGDIGVRTLDQALRPRHVRTTTRGADLVWELEL